MTSKESAFHQSFVAGRDSCAIVAKVATECWLTGTFINGQPCPELPVQHWRPLFFYSTPYVCFLSLCHVKSSSGGKHSTPKYKGISFQGTGWKE